MSNLNELRSRINDLSRIALQLHSGSNQELFDSLQAKIGRVMKVFALHEHDSAYQNEHHQTILLQLEKCEKTSNDALQKLAQLEIQRASTVKQKKEIEAKAEALSTEMQSLENVAQHEKTMRLKYERKLNSMNVSFESQNAKIKEAQAVTDANLKQLHKWLKDERLKSAALKDMNDELKISIGNLEQTVGDLTSDVNDLEQDKDKHNKLRIDCELLTQKNAQLTQAKQSVAMMFEDQTAKTAELESKFATLKDKYDQCMREKSQLETQVTDCESRIKEFQSKSLKQTTLFEQQQKEKNALEQEMSKKRDLYASLKTELEAQKTLVSTKDEFIQELKHEMSLLQSSCDLEMEKQRNELIEQKTQIVNDYQQKVSDLTVKCQQLSNETQDLKLEKQKENAEFTKLVAVLENEKEASSKLLESQRYLQSKCDNLDKQLTESTATIHELKTNIDHLEHSISEKDEIIQSKDEVLQMRNADVENINKKLKTSVNLLESTEDKLYQLQSAAQELNNSKNQIVDLKANNSKLTMQVNNLNDQVNVAEEKVQQLREKISKQRSSYKILLDKDESELNNLTYRLTNAQKEASEYGQKNQYLRQLIHDHKEGWAEEKSQLQDLIDKLKQDYDYEVRSNKNNKEISSKQLQTENSKTHLLKIEIEKRDRLLSKLTMEISKLKAELALKSANMPMLRQSQKTFHVLDKNKVIENDKTTLPFSKRFVIDTDITGDSFVTDSFL